MQTYIQNKIADALSQLGAGPDTAIQVERSRHPEHGHYSCNAALILAKVLKQAPLSIAKKIATEIADEKGYFEKVEVKAPGFINIFLTPAALQSVIPEILDRGSRFGSSKIGQEKKVQVEFVSANPTGPLTVGHGRQAVLGDTLARILTWNGYQVDREYYYNDAGRQMRILGHSTYIRYRQLLGFDDSLPEDHYQGEYIKEIARDLVNNYGDRFKADPENPIFQEQAEKAVFRNITETLQRLDIVFNRFYNEKTLYEDGHINQVLTRLAELQATYEKDGAIWFRAGQYGGTEDRVLWKSVVDEATYRLPDIAYHVTKFERGYELVVDIFGADHIATYPDVLAGLNALGYESNRVKVLIHQFVTLTRGGEKIKMSTRKATYVTLDELIDEVGKDVVRFFFLMRGIKSHLNFDLELAKTEGDENPVFYLQYAHARISSILRQTKAHGIQLSTEPQINLLKQPEELILLDILAEFKDISRLCCETLEPHHLTTYLQKMATAFHKFYTEHRVLQKDKQLAQARLALCQAAQIVLANGLHLLGINAPERM
jgi:arginyl-tRNA synthetase